MGTSPRRPSRRDFLQTTATTGMAAGLGGLLWGAPGARAQSAANSKIEIGVIGVAGMGKGHLRRLLGMSRVAVKAIADVDRGRLDEAVNKIAKGSPTGYADYREMLATESLDAVCIATPDHWHATQAIHAMEAGLDVFVEKPMMHNVREGRDMINCARRLGRVVQLGTQQRAQSHFRHVVQLVRNGAIGEVKRTRCWFAPGDTGGWEPDSDPPAALDWDLWLGPAPLVQYNKQRCHYSWRLFWDYGGGKLTDWGVHLMDIVHWAMGQQSPLTVEAEGRYHDGGFDTPNEIVIHYEYPGFTLDWTQLNNQQWEPKKKPYGIMFYGSEATLFVDRGGYYVLEEGWKEPSLDGAAWRLPRDHDHWGNFLDCMVTRQLPHSDVEVGHHSTVAPILGNIAFRAGRKLEWDGVAERFPGNPAADRLLSRPPRPPYTY